MAAEDGDDDDVIMLLPIRRRDYLRLQQHRHDLAVIDAGPPAATWREKLWTAPPETRLTMREACEALNMSEPTVRKHMKNSTNPLPYRRLPIGKKPQVQFLCGELRTWLNAFEVA